MPTRSLRGMGVALTTPFLPDESIDYATLDAHIDYLAEGGADYIVALGTTAETPTLSADEKRALALHILDRTARRIPVVLGMGGNCTRNLVAEIKAMPRLEEFDAILSVVPYYNKPTQEGMYRHFSRVAEASPIPVILYNIPGRTGVNMTVDTVIRLAIDYPGKVIGIKEASGNMEQAGLIIARRPEGFLVISGDDSLAHTMIGLGGDGVISVLGNAYPRQFSDMIHLSMDPERRTEALPLHQSFSALYSLLFKEGNPSGIKSLMHCVIPGYHEVLRLPLVPVGEMVRNALKSEADKMR
ncbi:MAG: 4-hydroxy-tetrahydrodipicolinate synthase [Duncaniella sp.]|nr:4-hydroxy-tetrahydrodipicolinate synthase [Duncaniella sp.]MDE5734236.1 4-hydroxy-tetrahydrodipicolinate synthase [Duncaniella sp.]